MAEPAAIYRIEEENEILTPALVIYPELVDANIRATLQMARGDAERWRPHIKTAKLLAVLQRLLVYGVRNLKCSTTLELLTACEAGAADVLLAYAVMGANARRAREIAEQFPETRVSVLVETVEQTMPWRGSDVGIFIDVNSGMNRTGIRASGVDNILEIARSVAAQFRGVHYYDGHVSGGSAEDREKLAHGGYRQLLEIAEALERGGVPVGEVITSGTPTAPSAVSFAGFRERAFVHRISPGTVVYNDLNSIAQLPDFGYQPAALVLATVVSQPTAHTITCDAGHKSVSADAGVPTCGVLGHMEWSPAKPSEEHLPIEVPAGENIELGQKLYLVPRHVCPTVNNFDEALFVVDGKIRAVERVTARGHESPVRTATYAS